MGWYAYQANAASHDASLGAPSDRTSSASYAGGMPAPTEITRDRIAQAMSSMGLVPFRGGDDQLAALVPGQVVRIVLPEGRPQQGMGEWSRTLDIRFAPQAAMFTRHFNAATYLPKLTTAVGDDGQIRFRIQHLFNWSGGASDEQLAGEVRQFFMASFAAFGRLDQEFPDQWKVPRDG